MFGDLLAGLYPYAKTLHVVSVIAWMAGLFYLPRLFVYHAEQGEPQNDELFQTMERRLLKIIMQPAMISSWIFGLALVITPGIVNWSLIWPWIKAGSVVVMTGFHFWLEACQRDFAAGRNRRSGRTYRLMNEVPTILMLLIVSAVIIKF